MQYCSICTVHIWRLVLVELLHAATTSHPVDPSEIAYSIYVRMLVQLFVALLCKMDGVTPLLFRPTRRTGTRFQCRNCSFLVFSTIYTSAVPVTPVLVGFNLLPAPVYHIHSLFRCAFHRVYDMI